MPLGVPAIQGACKGSLLEARQSLGQSPELSGSGSFWLAGEQAADGGDLMKLAELDRARFKGFWQAFAPIANDGENTASVLLQFLDGLLIKSVFFMVNEGGEQVFSRSCILHHKHAEGASEIGGVEHSGGLAGQVLRCARRCRQSGEMALDGLTMAMVPCS